MLLDEIKCTRTNLGKSTMTSGDAFRVTLSYKGRKCSFIFNDNYLNKCEKVDFIYCLLRDADAYNCTKSFEDFAFEFGYNEDSMKAYKIYKECKKQAERTKRLFKNIEIMKLYTEMNNFKY